MKVLIGFTVLVLVAFATPVAAADNDFEGWFAALDLALTQPNSLDHNLYNSFGFVPVEFNERHVLDNDSDFTFSVDFGYSWGEMGSLRVSYWNFDNEDRQTGDMTGYFYPAIFGYGYYGSLDYLSDPFLDARAEVEATTYDVDYVRPIEVGDNFTLNWLVGLRVAQYEETQSIELNDGSYYYTETKQFESDAFGLRVGVTAVMGFGDNFALEGGMAVSFMQADTEGVATQDDGSPLQVRFAEDDNIRGEIREYHVKGVWTAGPVDWYLGYSAADWDGLVTDPLAQTGDDLLPLGPSVRGRETISFNSINAGIIWRFGGGGP